MKKTYGLVIMIVLILTLVISGCGSKQSSPSSSSSNGSESSANSGSSGNKNVKLTMIMQASPESEMFKKLADMYMNQNPNVTVKIEENGREGYFDRLKNQLLAKSSSIDIASFTNNQIGLFAASGVLESLTPYLANKDLNYKDFNDGMFIDVAKKGVTFKGDIYGLPYNTSTFMLFYRTDLIKNPPQTWDEYYQLAKQFTKSVNPNSPTQYGTTMMAKRGNVSPPDEFSMVVRSFGGDYISENDDILINNEGSVNATKFWVKMFKEKLVPPDVTSYDYTEVLQAFQEGKTAMAIQWDAAAGSFQDAKTSPKIHDKFAAALIPGVKQADGTIKRAPYVHNWVNVINKFSKNKEEAYKFLSFASHPDNYSKVLDASNTTALKAIMDSPEYKKGEIAREAYVKSLEAGQTMPANQYVDRVLKVADFALAQSLSGELSPEQSLNNAADEIKKMMGK